MIHTVREALALLKRDGWVLVRQAGSHRKFHHPAKPGSVTVAGERIRRSIAEDVGLDSSTGRVEMKYAVIFEHSGTGFSAYVPDLDGCVAAGRTLDETRSLITGAIAMHLEGMREDGDAIPEPSISELVEVEV